MSTNLEQPINDMTMAGLLTNEIPHSLDLNLVVTDVDSVKELILRREGRDRDEYALSALKIGVLSLRHATGQIDVEAVRREGDRLLTELDQALENSRVMLNGNLSAVLKEY